MNNKREQISSGIFTSGIFFLLSVIYTLFIKEGSSINDIFDWPQIILFFMMFVYGLGGLLEDS